MAEFCKDCFVKDIAIDEYEKHNIIFNDTPSICVGCGQYKTVVLKIDRSYLLPIKSEGQVLRAEHKRIIRGCPVCGELYTYVDIKKLFPDQICPHCNQHITELWTSKPVKRTQKKYQRKINFFKYDLHRTKSEK